MKLNPILEEVWRIKDELPAEKLATLWGQLHLDDLPVEVNRQQRELALREPSASYGTRRRKR
jgi:hypothetical protein